MNDPSPAGKPRTHVKGFDGLRAGAALVVFCEHKVKDIGTGAIGVWVFYCLSGYLIVGILQRARQKVEAAPSTLTTGQALLNFWKDRALRILPLYYGVLFALFLLTHVSEKAAFPWYLFYVQNFYIAWVSRQWSAITHFWSLALEQQFYLASAPLLLLVPARWHERTLAGIFGGCLALLLALELVHYDPFALSLLPPTSFMFMTLGGLARLIPNDSFGARLSRSAPVLAATATLFVLTFVLTRPIYDPMGGHPLVLYLTGLLFSGSLVSFVARVQEGRLVRLLELAPLRMLGVVSYGFYVFHPLVPGVDRLAHMSGIQALAACPRPLAILVEFSLAVVVSSLSWFFFERRFLALKARARAQPAHAA